MKRARLLLMVFGVYCLLFPFCALVLDHHFVERRHDHMHLYLERVIPNHIHPYEVFHAHSPAHEAVNARFQETPKSDQSPDGIVYLPAHDIVSQSLAQLTESPIHLSLGFPSLDQTSHSVSIPADNTNRPDSYLSPPKQPPRL